MTHLLVSAAMATSAALLQPPPPPIVAPAGRPPAAEPTTLPFENGWVRVTGGGGGDSGTACSASSSGAPFQQAARSLCPSNTASQEGAGDAPFHLEMLIEIAREGTQLPRSTPVGTALVQVADLAVARSGAVEQCLTDTSEGVALPDLCAELKAGDVPPFDPAEAPGLRRGRLRITTKVAFSAESLLAPAVPPVTAPKAPH